MNKKIYFAASFGFLLAIIIFISFRLITFKDPRVHYHANFAIYVNGVRDTLADDSFYEEISACDASQHNNPKSRAHLHDHKNSVIHIHDLAVSWGHLFLNLGYGLTNTSLKTDSGSYIDNDAGSRLHFYLNGIEEKAIANRVIQSEDALLVSYGNEDESSLKSEYASIVKDAAKYNHEKDPASCSGSQAISTLSKLKDIFGIKRAE